MEKFETFANFMMIAQFHPSKMPKQRRSGNLEYHNVR